MPPFGVEIDQIDEDQAALRGRRERLEEKVDVAVVALALALVPGVAMGEYVADLADRDDCAARARGPLQEIAVRRRNGEILAVGGSREVLGARAEERPGDHAPDLQRIAEAGARCGKAHRAARARKPPHARRSGAPSRRRCNRWASASAGAPRHSRRSPRCPKRGGWRECRRACLGDQRLGQRRREGGNRLREIAPVESTGVPASSQWPDGVSLPREVSIP